MKTTAKIKVFPNYMSIPFLYIIIDDCSSRNTYLRTEFMNSKIFFWSYVIKNILEFLIASIYAWWLLIQNFNSTLNCPTSSSCELIYQTTCSLRDLEYSCIMPNVQFYFSISMFGFILLIIYLCCNVYTFLWLLNKRLRKLSNFLQFYVKQDEIQENDNKWAGNKKQNKRNVLASLQSPDVDLLLDLLAEKHGVENAIKILGNYYRNVFH